MTFLPFDGIETVSQVVIGSVWVFHGCYSKILNGIPRHQMIVGRILGARIAKPATKVIGCLEVILGLWVFTGVARVECALVQTLAIIGMNTVEIIVASDLLISAVGMVALNLGFLALIWNWAFIAAKP
jgi:hypothetical protein